MKKILVHIALFIIGFIIGLVLFSHPKPANAAVAVAAHPVVVVARPAPVVVAKPVVVAPASKSAVSKAATATEPVTKVTSVAPVVVPAASCSTERRQRREC